MNKSSKIEIIPAIMPKGLHNVTDLTESMLGLAKVVQLDLMDGNFVPNRTWPYSGKYSEDLENLKNESIGMPFWEEVDYEIDLMVSPKNIVLQDIIAFSPKRIIFHYESWHSKDDFYSYIENLDTFIKETIEIGIAIGTNTDVKDIFPIMKDVSFVQCMGIEKIGFQGEPFDERVLEQIRMVKEYDQNMIVSVDGSVNFETIDRLIEAGADRLVVGSAIFDGIDPRGNFLRLEEITESGYL